MSANLIEYIKKLPANPSNDETRNLITYLHTQSPLAIQDITNEIIKYMELHNGSGHKYNKIIALLKPADGNESSRSRSISSKNKQTTKIRPNGRRKSSRRRK